MLGLKSLANVALAGRTGIRLDPWTSFNFVLELDGLFIAAFSKVEGLEASIQVEDFYEGGRNDAAHKLLGATQWQNLALVRGMTEIEPLWNWFAATARGQVERRSGAIFMLNTQRMPVNGWVFHGAVPVRWVGPSFDASRDSEVAVERIELAHTGLEQPSWMTLVGLAARAKIFLESGLDG